jgi:formylglycine-generating enzyme required for sulfatase activity
MAHQSQEARPLNLVRPEVPEELAALVRKMMAKSPAKRYQTPLEVVQALGLFVKQGAAPKSSPELSMGAVEAKPAVKKPAHVEPPPVPAEPAAKQKPEPANVRESLAEGNIARADPQRREKYSDLTVGSLLARSLSFLGPRKGKVSRKPRAAAVREGASWNEWLIGVGLGLGVLLLVLLGMWVSGVFTAKVKTADGILIVEVNEPNAEVLVDGETVTVSWHDGGKKAEIRVPPGTHKVEVKKDGFSVDSKELTFKDGGREIFTARLLPNMPERREAKAEAPQPEKAPPKPEKVAEQKQEPPERVPLDLGGGVTMEFVRIPKGKFLMGSPEDEQGRNKNKTQHEVEITHDFYLGKYEVTRGQFRAFVEAKRYQTEAEKDSLGGLGYDAKDNTFKGPKWDLNLKTGNLKAGSKTHYSWKDVGFAQTDEHPVVNVSWNDATAFCDWLARKSGRSVRLPTEAEWEYACRAGTRTRFNSGDDDAETLARVGNVADGKAKKKFPSWKYAITAEDGYVFTAPVGQFKPNRFGLYDMHGNVWEWCRDWFGPYAGLEAKNPLRTEKADESTHVFRGGSFKSGASSCRAASRGRNVPGYRECAIGFRVALYLD